MDRHENLRETMPAMNDHYLTVQACPLCGAGPDAWRHVTDAGSHFSCERAVMCGACTMVFLTPRMSPAGLASYYATDAFSVDFRGAASPDAAATALRDQRARRRWNFLRDHLPTGGRCLEIGCSSGNFLKILSDHGFDTHGIDPSTGYAAFARARGLRVQSGQFPADLPAVPNVYHAIAAFHVIEHVHQPERMLADIRRRLGPAGILALEYPDVDRAAEREELLPSYFQKSHLYDFSFLTIGVLLRRVGLDVVATFHEQERPYDKNVLLVARPASKQTVSLPVPPDTANRFHERLTSKLARSISRQHARARKAVWRSPWRRLWELGRHRRAG